MEGLQPKLYSLVLDPDHVRNRDRNRNQSQSASRSSQASQERDFSAEKARQDMDISCMVNVYY